MLGFLGRLLLGKGRMRPALRAELESEGLVLVEEGLPTSVRYHRFRAPGRYHHGKIVLERSALGISARRVVLYCRNGRAKLVDSEFSSPRLRAVDFELADGDRVAIKVDYDELGEGGVTGRIEMRVRTPQAARIVRELNARVAAAAAR